MKRYMTAGPAIAALVVLGVAAVPVNAQEAIDRLAAATLFGLPARDGRVQWPLGLRILAPANEAQVLRDQLEVDLYFVATQDDEGKVNQVFIAIGLQTTRDLRQLLRRRHESMAAATYTDAMRFLDRAERGLTQMNAIATSSDGAHP